MKILLVIDVQEQFGSFKNCLEFIELHRKEYDRVVATLFVNDRKANGNFVKKLKYKDCSNATIDDIPFKADQIIIKSGYSIPQGFFGKKDEIDVIGCETDACVLASCFTLWDDGCNFNVLWDYVDTASDTDKNELRKIYKRNFGV